MTLALVFANGDLNAGPMVQRALDAARANPDAVTVIAADGGARLASQVGLLPDLLVGDMDSLTADELHGFQEQGVKVRRYDPQKNQTDLEIALEHLADRGAARVRIIGAVGDRMDQTLGNVHLLALPALAGIDVRLLANRQQMWLAQPGEHAIDGEAGDTLSLIPVTGAVRGIHTGGLQYALHDEDLAFGPARGISNVIEGAGASVRFGSGLLLIVHTLGRA